MMPAIALDEMGRALAAAGARPSSAEKPGLERASFASAAVDIGPAPAYNQAMQDQRRKRPPGTGFFFLGIGALVAAPAIVFIVARPVASDSVSWLLAAMTAVFGFLLLHRLYDLEPTGPTRRHPGPDDHVLSARERLWSTGAGLALLGLTLGIHFLLPRFGLDNDSIIAEGAIVVTSTAAFALTVRGLYGVDHAGSD